MEFNRVHINELLQDAALKGDVTILRALLGQDPLLLHRPSNVHPLHTASRLGHLQFTEELLRINPSLAEELDPIDKSSPLHLASGNGRVDVVKALVSANACMCVARDVHGRNPAHVAAMKGHVPVLEELIRAVLAAARERVGGGGESTIMHLCVKFNQVEALSLVARAAGDAGMLLNAMDGDGNTALHIAVTDQRLKIIHLLVRDNRVKKNMQNGYGLTAMDILITQNNKDGINTNPGLSTILGGRQAKLLSSKEMNKKKEKERQSGWIESQRNALMVVASLVATMAFQAGLTPPFLQEKMDNLDLQYKEFVIFNTIGLVSSMSSIILLISGLPGRRFFMIVVLVMMWVALTSMTYVYGISLRDFTLKVVIERSGDIDVVKAFYRTYITSFCAWACVMALILLGHLVTWTVRFCKKLNCLVKKIRLCC